MDFYKDTELSPSTKTLFNIKIQKWITFMPDDKKDILSIFMNPDDSVKHLLDKLDNKNNSNLHGYYSAVISFLNHNTFLPLLINNLSLQTIKEKWYKLREDNEKPIIDRRLQNKPTVIQEKKGGTKLTFADIVRRRDELKFGSIERLLLAFYTYIPPVRADYFATEIINFRDKPTEQNYIRRITSDISKCVLRDFKTKKAFTKIENMIPEPLQNELNESLRINPRNYLFLSANGKPFTRNAFSVWSKRLLSKVFDTEFTLVMIRHLYISSLNFNKLTTEQLIEIGNKMGHSIHTQRDYNWVDNADSDKSSVDEDDTKNVIIEG
jgi:hypothetical protein